MSEPHAALFPSAAHLLDAAFQELEDDAIAELLADRWVELITSGADPVTARRMTNALREDHGLEPYTEAIGRKAIAEHIQSSHRHVRELEARALEKLRLALPASLIEPDEETP